MFIYQETIREKQSKQNSLEEQVGNTPLLQLTHTAVAYGLPETVQLYAKAEWFNPSGSVKDRPALNIIRAAEEDGRLWPGMTILEGTHAPGEEEIAGPHYRGQRRPQVVGHMGDELPHPLLHRLRGTHRLEGHHHPAVRVRGR